MRGGRSTQGGGQLRVGPGRDAINHAETVIAFAVSDTGLGIRKLPADPRFTTLPTIVVTTVKAMKADSCQCIEAGASDYISKPVDVNHLVGSLLRASLNRH